ncbi:MAG: helix-turn-helix transcriptional regulator [Candidatus Dormibacteraeota bacterium]|uniref:Transcriptional regulator n=1 Tax=Candidatus Aeolococcus gillhamiae TaxID=3127015 RepID=A0A2W5ZDQ2_9BACT|nr:helix-turn-helix transcriptional regulator [Candidatus Dormibacteraeota bacterium]PZR83579.1 MAG: transcriptional regulator [Candidatus Dormibacter sp. RRmetagenome_bin12]
MSLTTAQAGLCFAEEKWNLRILSAILWKPMGFNQLCRYLAGISPNTLAKRLDRLEMLGLVDRRVICATPPATQYSATAAAGELRSVLVMARWGARYVGTRQPDADRATAGQQTVWNHAEPGE